MATGSNPLLLIEELRELGEATVTALTEQVPALRISIRPSATSAGTSF
jgi:hypothetical protein